MEVGERRQFRSKFHDDGGNIRLQVGDLGHQVDQIVVSRHIVYGYYRYDVGYRYSSGIDTVALSIRSVYNQIVFFFLVYFTAKLRGKIGLTLRETIARVFLLAKALLIDSRRAGKIDDS